MVRQPHISSFPQNQLYQRGSWVDERQDSTRFTNESGIATIRNPSYQQVDKYSVGGLRGWDITLNYTDDYQSIESALQESCGIDNFALISVQEDGQFETYTSSSMRNLEAEIFTPNVLDVVRRMGRSQPGQPYPHTSGRIAAPFQTSFNDARSRRQSGSTDSSRGYRSHQYRHESSEDEETIPTRRKRPRGQHHQHSFGANSGISPQPQVTSTKAIMIGDQEGLEAFYSQRCKDLQQSACKVLAKAWVKQIEPKKQTNYPYTKGHKKAPAWWPLPSAEGLKDGVRHREPDHLLKPERVRLLVHILLLVLDSQVQKPETMQNITVKHLEEASYEAMQPWFNDKEHPDNATKKPYLAEIFKVAKLHERYKRGEVDDTASVSIMHGDPNGGLNGTDDEIDDGLKFEDEDEGHDLTPVSSMATPPDNLVSPIGSSHHTILSHPRGVDDASFYSGHQLPMRPQYFPNSTDDHHSYTEHYRSSPSMYPTPKSAYDQSRRPSYAIPTNNGFPPAPPSIFNPQMPWQTEQQQPLLTPQNCAYTTAPQHNNHAAQLPPPTQMMTHHQQQYHTGNVYEPPPLQHQMRTCTLPGPSGYSEFLTENTYGTGLGDIKDEGIQHQR